MLIDGECFNTVGVASKYYEFIEFIDAWVGRGIEENEEIGCIIEESEWGDWPIKELCYDIILLLDNIEWHGNIIWLDLLVNPGCIILLVLNGC